MYVPVENIKLYKKFMTFKEYHKMADSAWVSLHLRNSGKSATSLSPLSNGLSGTRSSTLKSAGINDPEGSENYNNTELKYGATFYGCRLSLIESLHKEL
jgi:hypothetical protein